MGRRAFKSHVNVDGRLCELTFQPTVQWHIGAQQYSHHILMLAELRSRFSALNNKAIQGLYKDDLPSPDHLQTEIDRWQRKWKLVKEEGGILPSIVPEILAECNSIAYLKIYVILQIILVIPVTTASVEGANSSSKFVKTALRSSMTNTRLNALMGLFVHSDIDLDLDTPVGDYARAHPQRMQLNRPLGYEEPKE